MIAVVTHGDFANALLGAAVGATPRPRLLQPREHGPDAAAAAQRAAVSSLGYVNRTPHLDGARPVQDPPMPPV